MFINYEYCCCVLLHTWATVYVYLNSFLLFVYEEINTLMLNWFSGPPFSHQRTPDHMVYYGASSCEVDFDHYLECLKSLWRRRSQNRETPIIINTMGWVKGQHRLRLWQLWAHIVILNFPNCKCSLKMCLSFLSTGFGFQILVDLIRFFPVSHVIQLGHSETTQCPALTPEFLRTAHGYQTHPPAQTTLDDFTESHNPPRSYVHITVQSKFEGVALQGTA